MPASSRTTTARYLERLPTDGGHPSEEGRRRREHSCPLTRPHAGKH